MRTRLTKNEDKKLVGARCKDGSIVFFTSIPLLNDRGYCVMMRNNSISATTGCPRYWIEDKDAEPIYEGDTLTIEF